MPKTPPKSRIATSTQKSEMPSFFAEDSVFDDVAVDLLQNQAENDEDQRIDRLIQQQ